MDLSTDFWKKVHQHLFISTYIKSICQAKKGKSRREAQQVTEGPLIDLSAAQPMRGQYSGHVTSVDQSEGAQPETDAERLAKLKVIIKEN